MDGISSRIFLPSTTKSGTKKSFDDKIVSLTRDRMASLVLNLLFLLNGYMCSVFGDSKYLFYGKSSIIAKVDYKTRFTRSQVIMGNDSVLRLGVHSLLISLQI